MIAVDLYGQCADLEPIAAACERHGVILIEDAAEAIGASYRSRAAGAFGQCAIFSFMTINAFQVPVPAGAPAPFGDVPPPAL